MKQPGLVAFLGSGETSAIGGQVFSLVAETAPRPFRAAVLETPAGFELNSAQVAGRVAEYIARRLQNERPEVNLIPARRKGTSFSPDEEAVVKPLYQASLVFLGPGSPTYAARQLSGSLAWDILRARHLAGAPVVFASAAVVAAGKYVLPVYEIYKAGLDPFWAQGLDFLSTFGLSLTFIPHWDNTDGGAELDTSRCFVGQDRFEQMRSQLPADHTVVGIGEHTGLVLDLHIGKASVLGRGSVTLLRANGSSAYPAESVFNITELGDFRQTGDPIGIDPEIVRRAADTKPAPPSPTPTPEVQALLAARQAARQEKNWKESDRLRQEIQNLGWQIKDTPDGPSLELL